MPRGVKQIIPERRPTDDPLYRTSQAAEYVGYSRGHFNRYVNAGMIAFELKKTLSGGYRRVYRKSELERFKNRAIQPHELC